MPGFCTGKNSKKTFLKLEKFSHYFSQCGWRLVDEEELDNAIANVQRMRKENTLQQFYEKMDATRRRLGQSITIFAQKSVEKDDNGST